MRNRVVFGLALAIGMSSLVFAQANLAGKWSGTVAGRGGDQPVVLELTVSGTTITGKLTTGAGMPVDITNAKMEGNKLTFSAAGGGGGRGGGGGAPGGGAPGGGAPPAGAPPAGGGAPGGGGPGGGAGAGGGRGGGGVQNYTATVTGSEMSVTREAAAPAGGGAGAPGGAPPAGGGAPGGGAPGGGAGAPGGGGRGGGPVTFTLKKG